MLDRAVIRNVCDTLLAGAWDQAEISKRLFLSIDNEKSEWLTELSITVLDSFPASSPAPLRTKLVDFLRQSYAHFLHRVCTGLHHRNPDDRLRFEEIDREARTLESISPPAQQMVKIRGRFYDVPFPDIPTVGALKEWLGITAGELDWFADLKYWECVASSRCRNYRYRWIPKRFGIPRLIEAPKYRLKTIQRRLLDDILSLAIPHDAAHGFRRGRGICSALRAHTGKYVVLHMDINQFFPSLDALRVHSLFRSMGYPERVASYLVGLCTNRVPRDILAHLRESSWDACVRHFDSRYVPQGAPTSPALANLIAYKLDARLSGLARACGGVHTRYADDLVFSGDAEFSRQLPWFRLTVRTILLDVGFQLQTRKTRVMHAGHRQQVAGIVLNEKLNLNRRAYDQLKATLYNCRKNSPKSQNTDSVDNFMDHLRGKIAWHDSINPVRGAKLKKLWNEIDWS